MLRFLQINVMKTTHFLISFTVITLVFVFLPNYSQAAPLLPDTKTNIFSANSELLNSFPMSSRNEVGGNSIAIADLGKDGIPEILIGGGFGNAPIVYVLRQDGSEIGSFLAYAPNMGSGINVIACDIDGDNINEIVTAPQRSGGPHVRVFDQYGIALGNGGNFAYTENFRGGINLACGDLDNDGRAEIVTMPAADGGPHVKIWNADNGSLQLQDEFFAFDASHHAGLVGVVHNGNLTLMSQRAAHDKTIKTFSLENLPNAIEKSTVDYDANGVSAILDINGELAISTTSNAQIIFLNQDKTFSVDAPFDSIMAAAGDLDGDGQNEIITTPYRSVFYEKNADYQRSVVIDLSDQRIFAYEYGVLAHTFLMSSARAGYTTPRGIHNVLAKPFEVHYTWSYGEDNINNYDLGLIPYNLRIFPHIYIHYAPWHNNFGIPQSHGCINVNLENIKWIYEWAQVGDQVVVQD